jgi:hypothetical protein
MRIIIWWKIKSLETVGTMTDKWGICHTCSKEDGSHILRSEGTKNLEAPDLKHEV